MINDPKLEEIHLHDLKLDSSVQRSWDHKWSKEIAADFNEDLLGVFRVSRRDEARGGGDYIIDGQHRLHALKALELDENDTYVQALVYEGLTQEEEALLFDAFNVKTRNVNSVDSFRLQVVAKDPEASQIQDVLNRHGLHVAYGTATNVVSAVAALRWIYRQGGVVLLDRTLTVIETAWGAKDRWSRDGNMLKGVAYVLLKIPTVNQDSLEEKLGKSGRPGQILGTARTYRAATKRSLWLETAHQVVAIYNTHRRERRVAL